MSLFSYKKYKIRIAPDSKKSQGLQCGDVVRRQYIDGENLIYSLMVVLLTGVDTIENKSSPYFIGALVDGVRPQNGELLDFVRITNLLNKERSGALYLTSSDSEAPYMDVIDGMAMEKSVLYTDSTTRLISTTPIFKRVAISKVEHPERLLIMLKVRASKTLNDVPLSFGYVSDEQIDGADSVSIGTDWGYILSVITVDFPKEYDRCLKLNFSNHLLADDWCEIASVNVAPLSAVANFSDSSKVRVGKITGINDPLFGILEGYGAYFQNLYATQNINIAGTLTAGDENGYASTFYVGKIHKNCFINSLEGNFTTPTILPNITSPLGIGNVSQLPIGKSTVVVQTNEWLNENVGDTYCFSFYTFSDESAEINISLLDSLIKTETINETWKRVYISFPIPLVQNGDLCIDIISNAIFYTCSYQLERAKTPSLYQATDSRLSNTNEYGAWFNRGGIGGTIQNPLLKLNSDGSISSRDDAFVINSDGTGHFSGGRFRWTKDSIELQDVAIVWKDLDDEAKENLSDVAGRFSVYVESSNGNSFISDTISTTLTAKVYKGQKEITETLLSNLFNWTRVSENKDDDIVWNEQHKGIGDTITITEEKIYHKAVFNCEVLINE